MTVNCTNCAVYIQVTQPTIKKIRPIVAILCTVFTIKYCGVSNYRLSQESQFSLAANQNILQPLSNAVYTHTHGIHTQLYRSQLTYRKLSTTLNTNSRRSGEQKTEPCELF